MKELDTQPQPTTHEAYDLANLAMIAEAYNLSTLHFVSKPTNGIMTENAILEDEGGERYFAKLYKTEDTEKYHSTYHAAALIAENKSIPVALPYQTADNSRLVTIADNQLVLFKYITHNEASPRDEIAETRLAANMARNLGLIHAVSVPEGDTILKPIERWRPNQNEKRKQTLVDIITIIQNKSELDDFDTLALETATKKLELLARLPKAKNESGKLSICHGDFHANNTLYNDNMDIIAICDWDNAGLSHPYIDFLNTFIMAVIGRRYQTYQTDRLDIATVFIKKYTTTLGEEIDLAEMEIAYHTLMSERICTTWPMNQHYLEGNTNQDGRLKVIAEKATTLATHYDSIWNFILTAIQATKNT